MNKINGEKQLNLSVNYRDLSVTVADHSSIRTHHNIFFTLD